MLATAYQHKDSTNRCDGCAEDDWHYTHGPNMVHSNNVYRLGCPHCKYNCGRACIVMLGKKACQDDVFTSGATNVTDNHEVALTASDLMSYGMTNTVNDFAGLYPLLRITNGIAVKANHALLLHGARKNRQNGQVTASEYCTWDPEDEEHTWQTSLDTFLVFP